MSDQIIVREDRVLPIFLHLPRTAGTSFQRVAENFLGKSRILAIYGSDIESPKEVIRHADLTRIKLIRGHFSYGVHEALPSEYANRFKYFTIVRHPVDRVVSLYNYIRRSRPHSFHTVVKDMSLLDFVTSGVSVEVDNGQVRQLAGIAPLPQTPYAETMPPFDCCNYGLLDLACQHLISNFAFALPFDRLIELAVRMKEFFDWRIFDLPHVNTAHGPQSKRSGSLTAEELQTVRDHNELDLLLYQYVRHVLGDEGGV